MPPRPWKKKQGNVFLSIFLKVQGWLSLRQTEQEDKALQTGKLYSFTWDSELQFHRLGQMHHHLLSKWNLYLLQAPMHLVCSIFSQKYRVLQSLYGCANTGSGLWVWNWVSTGKKSLSWNASLTFADWGATYVCSMWMKPPSPGTRNKGMKQEK